jgi:RNA polymerase sigma factor (sigma-70 family)
VLSYLEVAEGNLSIARILLDVEGLAHTIRRVKVGVYGVANGDTEDVVQEALARAIKSGVSLEAEQWLRTVAKRVAIDQHRRRRETPSGAPTELENYAPATDDNPEEAFIRAERSEAVREALAALPPRYRQALEAYSEEDSPAGVAKRLGLSAAATWTLLSRARTRLRLQLESVGFVPALVNLTRSRWRGLAAAGAAAGVAATAAILPQATTPSQTPAKPKVQHVATAPLDVARPAAAKKPLLPAVPTKKVTETVDDAVASARKVHEAIAVKTCLGPNDLIKVDIGIGHLQRQTLLARALERLPESTRVIGERTCAPRVPAEAPTP